MAESLLGTMGPLLLSRCPLANANVWKRGRFFIMAALALGAGAVQGQMFKCVSPAGKVEYRGSPCDDARQSTGMSGGTVSGIDAMSRQEMQRAQRSDPEPRQSQAATASQKSKGPSQQDIQALEVKASSVTISAKEKKFLQQELARAKAAQAGQGSYDDDDVKRLKAAQADQNRIDAKDRDRAKATAEDIHLRKGSDEVKQGIVADKQAEEARVNARRAAAAQQAARVAAEGAKPAEPSYDRISRCIYDNCAGSTGNSYRPVPGVKDSFTRQDGVRCTRSPDGQLTCW